MDDAMHVTPLTADTIAATLNVLPRRLEEAAGILSDLTPAGLGDATSQRAIQIMAAEMRLAAILLRVVAEPRLNA